MKLLLAIAEMGTGGAESVVCDLAAAAADAGDDVTVAAAPGPLDRRLEGVRLTRLQLPAQSPGLLRAPRTALALRAALRGVRPDLIHVHNPRVTALTRVARRLAGASAAPLLSTYHGVASERSRTAARLLRGVDRVAVVSAPLRDELVDGGVSPERVLVVRNGTAAAAPLAPERRRELDTELGLGEGPVVSAVGRLVAQKNHARFLAAVALAARDVPTARFLVVGGGPLEAALEEQARDLGLGERLRFTGVRADARDLIARSDLLVLSSDWEGFPLVALEGLAAGVPLLSTPVAGAEELSAAGAAEVVAPDERALADGLTRLLRDPEGLRSMGTRARELHAREFSVERMVGQYRRVYAELLAAAPTSRP